jgi:hypothetical protein
LDRGAMLYQMGIDKFLGNCLIKRLEDKQLTHIGELRDALRPRTSIGPGHWVDLAGLLAPEEAVQKMLLEIENGALSSLEQVEDRFRYIYENYPEYEWAWAVDVLEGILNKTIDEIAPDDVIELTVSWKKAVVELDRMLRTDAGKEFTATAQTGYGLDGDGQSKEVDFEQVRGNFEGNSFVREIEEHIMRKSKMGDDLIGRMEGLRQGQCS